MSIFGWKTLKGFFSTSLPLTSTRWVRTTIKLCTVHSLSSGLSLNLSDIKKFRKSLGERWESNPGRLGVKYEHYLCAMPTPQALKVKVLLTDLNSRTSEGPVRGDSQPQPSPALSFLMMSNVVVSLTLVTLIQCNDFLLPTWWISE